MLIEDIYKRYLNCSSVSTDTRSIEKGSMFFALKGPNFNANAFAKNALEKGSRYAVIDEEEYFIDERTILVNDSLSCLQELSKYHREQLSIPVIGITGSNGKTTTKELIHAVLRQKYKVTATKGNLNNHIGVPLSLLSISSETEIAIIEMGANHAGEIAFLCTLSQPDYGLITNIGKAHLEGFGDLQTIIETKTGLYRSVKNSKGKLFVNSKDELLMSKSEGINRILYPDKEGVEVEMESDHTPFLAFNTFISGKEKGLIITQLIGSYNLDNALAALTIGNYFNVEFDKLKSALESYSPSNNRSQWKKTEKNHLILDAYNANPSSTSLAIENFNSLQLENKLIILGDMLELGEDEKVEHQRIIDLLQKYKLSSIIIGPVFASCEKGDCVSFDNTQKAIEFLSKEDVKDKNILIKGSRGLKLESLVDYL